MTDISGRTVTPDERGLPLCAREYCEQYDGKRCRELGFRPDRFCEPQLVEDRAALRAELEKLREENKTMSEPIREKALRYEGQIGLNRSVYFCTLCRNRFVMPDEVHSPTCLARPR